MQTITALKQAAQQIGSLPEIINICNGAFEQEKTLNEAIALADSNFDQQWDGQDLKNFIALFLEILYRHLAMEKDANNESTKMP